MADDDADLTIGLDVVESGAAEAFGAMSQQLGSILSAWDGANKMISQAVGEVQQLNAALNATKDVSKEVAANAKLMGELTAKAAVAEEDIATRRRTMQVEQVQRADVNRIINETKTRDGRTIGQAGNQDQLVRGLITGIDTETAQVQARIRIAMGRATKRLFTSMEEAMAAEMRKAEVAVRMSMWKYDGPDSITREMTFRKIAEERRAAGFMGATSYDELVRVKAADKAAAAAKKAEASQQNYLDRTHYRQLQDELAEEERLASDPKYRYRQAQKQEFSNKYKGVSYDDYAAEQERERAAAVEKRAATAQQNYLDRTQYRQLQDELVEAERLTNDPQYRFREEAKQRFAEKYKDVSYDDYEAEQKQARAAAVDKRVGASQQNFIDSTLYRQQQAEQAEQNRLLTDPTYRLGKEKRARANEKIGDKSLEEYEAEQVLQAAAEKEAARQKKLAESNIARIREEERLLKEQELEGETAESLRAKKDAASSARAAGKDADRDTAAAGRADETQQRWIDSALYRQQQADQIEQNRLLTDPSYRIGKEKRARVNAEIGDKSEAEWEAEKEAQAAAEKEAARQKKLAESNIARIREEERLLKEQELEGETAESLRAKKDAASSARAAGKDEEHAARAAAREQTGYQNSMTGGLTGMIATGIAIGGIAETVGALKDLDDQMARFQAISGASGQQADDFKTHLLDLAAASRFSTSEIAEASTHLAQNGLSASEVLQVLPNAMSLATASGTTLTNSIEVLTSVLGSYNMESSQTGNLANIMTGALNKTRLTIEQLSYGLQYSSDIASQMGVSVTDLTAVFGGLAQAGVRSGSVMGTAVRQIIREFENPTQKLKEELNNLGISLDRVDIRSQGLIGVLDNLKAAGFGTAEAIRGLEARTVTTFAALMIQEDTVKRLKGELLLYNGAIDGAVAANESLVARLTQLGNGIVSVSDKAFAPFMDLLKGVVSGMGGMLEVVAGFGPLLPIIGTGIASIGVGLGVVTAARTVAGLAGAAAGLLGIAGASEAAAGGIAVLEVAMGPVGWIAGIAALAAAWATFGNSLGGSMQKLDELHTKISELDARINQDTITGQSLDKAINDVLEKRVKLNEDAVDRRNTIIEMQKQFADLGLTVDANAKSIDSLIEALRRLREEHAQGTPGMLADQIQQIGDRLDLRKQTQGAAEDEARYKLGGGRTTFDPITGKTTDPGRDYYVKTFGSHFGDIYDRATNFDKIKGNDAYFSTNANIGEINKTLDQMRDKGQSGSTEFGRLRDLLDQLRGAQGWVANNQSDEMQQERLRSQMGTSLLKGGKTYADLQARTENIRTGFTEDVHAIQDKKLGPEDEAAEIEKVKAKWTVQVDAARAAVEAQIAKLTAGGAPAEAIKTVYGTLETELKTLDNIATGEMQNLNKVMLAKLLPAKELQKRRLGQQKQLAQEKMRDSLSSDDLNGYADAVDTIIKQIADIDKQIIRIKSNAKQVSPEEATAADAEVDLAVQAERGKAAETRANEEKRLAEKTISFQEKALAAHMHNVGAQISDIEKQLRDPRTSEDKIKELVKKLDELVDQRIHIVDQQAGLTAASEHLTTPLAAVPTGNVQERMAAALAAAGHGDETQFALRLADHETGGTFDPNILNKQGSGAKGLFQYMPTTAPGVGLTPGKEWSVEEQVAAYIKYDQQNRAAFKKVMGRDVANDSEHYAIWQQGGTGAANLLANPNERAAKLVGGAAVTQNGGTLDMTAQQFFDKITEFMRTGQHSKNLRTTHDLIDDQKADTQSEARTKGEEDKRQARLGLAQRDHRDTKAVNNIADTRATQDISEWMSISKNEAATPAEVLANMRKVGDASRGKIGRALQDYDTDPKDHTTSKEDDEARLNTKVSHTDQYVSAVQKAAGLIEEAGLKEDKLRLKQAQERQKMLDEHPGKAMPGEIASTAKEVETLTKQISLTDALNGKTQALAYIQEELAKARKDGNVDQKSLNGLVETEADYKREIAELEKQQQFRKDFKSRPSGVGTGISQGTENYFVSQGMYDPKKAENGGWKTTTEQIAGGWSQMLGGMTSGMETFFTKWANGTERGKYAFHDFGVSVLQTMEQVVVKALSENTMKTLFGGLMGGGGSGGAGAPMQLAGAAAGTATSNAGGIASFFANLFHADTGGIVPGQDIGRDSQLAVVHPGEGVLKQSAMSAIGKDSFNSLNEMGNRVLSSTGTPSMPAAPPLQPINLWVAHPDQIPPPGPRDIVHHIAADISSGGQTKQLIKQVVAGQI